MTATTAAQARYGTNLYQAPTRQVAPTLVTAESRRPGSTGSQARPAPTSGADTHGRAPDHANGLACRWPPAGQHEAGQPQAAPVLVPRIFSQPKIHDLVPQISPAIVEKFLLEAFQRMAHMPGAVAR